MEQEHQALWERIQNHKLDVEGAPHPFSAKLAKQEHWTHADALAAIDEYKRFVFLGQVAGHMVTPSLPVDKVWHLHLQFTRDYWDVFCAQVLRRPFHHQPGQGFPEEDAKFEEAYMKTLESYERHFAEIPPARFWPRPTSPSPAAPTRSRRKFLWLPFSMVLVASANAQMENPLNMPGPEFLSIYAPSLLFFFAGAAILRKLMIASGSGNDEAALSTEQLAYLSGGNTRLLHATLGSLVSSGALQIGASTGMIMAKADQFRGTALEETLYNEARPGLSLATLDSKFTPHTDAVRDSLVELGLWAPPARANAARGLAAIIALIPWLVGLAKINVGFERERPVGYLIALSILYFAVVLIFALTYNCRTFAGSSALSKARAAHEHLKVQAKDGLDPMQVGMMFGLFGVMGGVPGTEALHDSIRRSSNGSSSCSSSTSSCSSGGDGGGGGGCGGGGCGGCSGG